MLASDSPVAAATVSREAFLGPYRDYHNPVAVESGDVHNPEAGTERLGASLRHDLDLAPGETRTLHCAVAVIGSVDEGRELAARLLAEGIPERLFSQQAATSVRHRVTTPDPQFDRWMNTGLTHQLRFVRRWGRVIGRGFRDILQDTFGHRLAEPEHARACILEVFSKEFPSGKCIRAWRLPTAELDLQDYADSPSPPSPSSVLRRPSSVLDSAALLAHDTRTMSASSNPLSMDTLASLCKRRGFIFQSSEIYGGINGFWDYGPLGTELKRNIREAWWRDMVTSRENIVGLDSSIIMHPRVWEASGHTDSFSDPMRTCQQCRKHFRSDDLDPLYLESLWIASVMQLGKDVEDGFVNFDTSTLWKWARGKGKTLAPGLALVRNPDVTLSWLAEKVERDGPRMGIATWMSHLATEQYAATGLQVPCPACGGELTEARNFKMMFETHIGAMQDSSSLAYLRPETAQGIFAQFANVLATSRQKIPFGIAQIGKAFRNEINPRNYTFRSREFEQMELEFFIEPGTDAPWHEYWVAERLKWYESIGLPPERLGKDVYGKDDLAHYASACVDITYEFPFGKQELEGIAARGDYDLGRHQEYSGKSMEYFDQENNRKYVPHVVEPSAGVDRIALALLCNAYREEWISKADGSIRAAESGAKPPERHEARTVMGFAPKIAPVKVAVFPLVKNKPELVEKARGVFEMLRAWWPCFWDITGAIGRRYRRQDEIGTPFCVTVDFDTLEDHSVTLRDRDTMKQDRVNLDALPGLLHDRLA